ncbi:phage holin, lambda family [Alteromonas sp. RKMC-009]|uniref:phage holin, lambda family n=1 Tax=Alteromonas sp. RKMC-009 TaxID=2267264 RepID=UPI00137557B6|nr:phage holin, lambda family [Alteromonas sp. RKMC-009]
MVENIKDLPPTVLGALMAIVISILRVMYDREETSVLRVGLEASLCGTLAVVAGSAITALGLDQEWTLFVGGVIGFVGSQSIRTYADRMIKRKIDN